jgi:murein L,D-transpeptidase YcbB/YkuD
VAIGRTDPASIDPRWKVRRTAPDLAGSLAQWASTSLDGWLDTVRPVHPEYAALQKALATLQPQAGSEAVDDDAARRIALNLERWRWMPDDLGERHLLVNVPAFYMAVREHGRPVLDMKVIVGKQDRATPLFSAVMKEVVFSPYWNVPDSIAEGETAPAAARDPKFLARNNIEVLYRGGSRDDVVDAASVDWSDPEAIKALAFRQKPGAGNALGHVKFLFPNPYDVYLHDTPADSLFARQGPCPQSWLCAPRSAGRARARMCCATAPNGTRQDPGGDAPGGREARGVEGAAPRVHRLFHGVAACRWRGGHLARRLRLRRQAGCQTPLTRLARGRSSLTLEVCPPAGAWPRASSSGC